VGDGSQWGKTLSEPEGGGAKRERPHKKNIKEIRKEKQCNKETKERRGGGKKGKDNMGREEI